MTNPSKVEHIKGFYLVLVAILSLVGGYFLKEPLTRVFSKKYSQIAGVWKPHGDILLHCNISTIRDTFYIKMEGTYVSMKNWVLKGSGKSEGSSGDFAGILYEELSNQQQKATLIWGHVEVAGSDQLGVTFFIDEKRKDDPRIFSFIRESQTSIETEKQKSE